VQQTSWCAALPLSEVPAGLLGQVLRAASALTIHRFARTLPYTSLEASADGTCHSLNTA